MAYRPGQSEDRQRRKEGRERDNTFKAPMEKAAYRARVNQNFINEVSYDQKPSAVVGAAAKLSAQDYFEKSKDTRMNRKRGLGVYGLTG